MYTPKATKSKYVKQETNPECGALVEWYWQGITEVLGDKPVSVPLVSLHIPHELTPD